jgi:hypothetical protein
MIIEKKGIFKKKKKAHKGKVAESKFHNRKVTLEDGTVFYSQKEYTRFLELSALERQGLIWNLQRQVKYTLLPSVYEEQPVQLKTKVKMKKVCIYKETAYVADFVYTQDGEEVVEDVKASAFFQDPVYKLKKKMMYMIHHIKIKEVY